MNPDSPENDRPEEPSPSGPNQLEERLRRFHIERQQHGAQDRSRPKVMPPHDVDLRSAVFDHTVYEIQRGG